MKGACVDVNLRDEIMSHASELIIQMIRAQNLHNIYPGRDDSSFNDLYQIAWVQIESTLYKFDYGPGHTKVFNMWSQVAKTVILAHIKKESRDRKNSQGYRRHIRHNKIHDCPKLSRFVEEAKIIFKYNEEADKFLMALLELYQKDDRPHEGLVGKLAEESGLSKQQVSAFLRQLRLRAFEFTDATLGEVTNNDEEDQLSDSERDRYNQD